MSVMQLLIISLRLSLLVAILVHVITSNKVAVIVAAIAMLLGAATSHYQFETAASCSNSSACDHFQTGSACSSNCNASQAHVAADQVLSCFFDCILQTLHVNIGYNVLYTAS